MPDASMKAMPVLASTGGDIVGWVLFAAIVVGIGYVLLRLLRRVYRTGSEARRVHALSPEDREHHRQVKRAAKDVRAAERDHKNAVYIAQADLKKAEKAPKLADYKVGENAWGAERRFVLYEDRIETPDGTHLLTPGVTATVETAGNLTAATKGRSTLTRMGAGAAIAGPVGLLLGAAAKKDRTRTIDKRELYLIIDGGTWATSAACNADHGERVRKFAQAVTITARGSAEMAVRRSEQATAARAALERTRDDRRAIEAAESQLRELEQSREPKQLSP